MRPEDRRTYTQNGKPALRDGGCEQAFAAMARYQNSRLRNEIMSVRGNGTVLTASGYHDPPAVQAEEEIHDPTKGNFALTGSLSTPRNLHCGALLQGGAAFVAGEIRQLRDHKTRQQAVIVPLLRPKKEEL